MSVFYFLKKSTLTPIGIISNMKDIKMITTQWEVMKGKLIVLMLSVLFSIIYIGRVTKLPQIKPIPVLPHILSSILSLSYFFFITFPIKKTHICPQKNAQEPNANKYGELIEVAIALS